jgi:CDGSH-type Zn-finger protein
MDKPKVAGRKPALLDLEPGTYYFCSCGLSAKQPFCDGSHRGSSFAPRAFEVEEACKMALCTCKQSGNGHLCDGSHKSVQE